MLIRVMMLMRVAACTDRIIQQRTTKQQRGRHTCCSPLLVGIAREGAGSSGRKESRRTAHGFRVLEFGVLNQAGIAVTLLARGLSTIYLGAST